MALPDSDASYLARKQVSHTVSVDGGMTCVVFPKWALPSGYTFQTADLLVRLQTGYPDIAPDMWWFDPAVRLVNGGVVPATDVIETHLGRQWQRWSRHLQPGQWKSGIDGLESYLALIRRELLRYVPGLAA